MTDKTDMSLRDAAQAVIDRWETPLWKDAPATAAFIADLRDALARDAGDMFEFWWADHAPNATQEEAWAEWCSLMRPGPVVAAPPTAQAEGWRDIATAPKDGTLILVNFGIKGVRAVSWDSPFHDEVTEENGAWCVDDDKHGPYGLRGYSDDGPTAPTHWMKLPESPYGKN